MKIAILTSGVMPVPAVKGGAVENLIDLYLAYNEQHKLHDITVYSVADQAVKRHPAFLSAVNHYRYINPFTLWAKVMKALHPRRHRYYNPSIEYYLRHALRHIRQQHYDIIIVENRPGYILKLRAVTDVPCVLHLHNDTLNATSKEADNIVKGYDKIICVSDYITRRVPDSSGKSITVYNAIDVRHFTDAQPLSRQTLGLTSDDFVIVYSGRLTPEKGILELIEAIKLTACRKHIKLLVVGARFYGNDTSRSPFTEQLEAACESIKEQVIFTGFIAYQQIPSYLKMADLAVVPSRWEEPFGLTVVEAMAAGLPLIATRSGGIPELCDGIATLVEREQLAQHLATAIDELYQDPAKRKEMAAASLACSCRFDKDTYAHNFFAVLNTLSR